MSSPDTVEIVKGWRNAPELVRMPVAMGDARSARVAARLRKLQDQRGMTNEALAREADVSVKTVQRWRGGRPSHDRSGTLERLAAALEVPVAELTGELGESAERLTRVEKTLEHLLAIVQAGLPEPELDQERSKRHVARGAASHAKGRRRQAE